MVKKSVAMRGVAGTILYASRWPLVIRNERRSLAERNRIQAEFDSRYGTDTAGIIPLSSFAIDNPVWIHGVRYAPTSPSGFQDSLALLNLGSEAYRDFSFIDVGAGKGATLLYAADLNFKAVYGIELVSELHNIAARNIELYPSARQIGKSICADATVFEMPKPPVIAFFNYPFSSEELMDKVLGNISRCGDGPKYAVTLNYPYDPANLPSARLRLISKVNSDKANRTNYGFEIL